MIWLWIALAVVSAAFAWKDWNQPPNDQSAKFFAVAAIGALIMVLIEWRWHQ